VVRTNKGGGRLMPIGTAYNGYSACRYCTASSQSCAEDLSDKVTLLVFV